MKTVSITKRDYDEVVYPCVACFQAENTARLRLADRLLTKLEEGCARDPKDRTGWPMYVMQRPMQEFELEEDEAALLLERIVSAVKEVDARRTRALLPVISALEEKAG